MAGKGRSGRGGVCRSGGTRSRAAELFSTKKTCPQERLRVLSYRATLDVPIATVRTISGWLTAHRRAYDIRPHQRACTTWGQAVLVLRWLKDGADVRTLPATPGSRRPDPLQDRTSHRQHQDLESPAHRLQKTTGNLPRNHLHSPRTHIHLHPVNNLQGEQPHLFERHPALHCSHVGRLWLEVGCGLRCDAVTLL